MLTAVTSRIAGLKGRAMRLLPGMARKPAVWGGLGALIAVIAVFYYPIGMVLTHQINDDVNYQVPTAGLVKDGSRSVAMAAALIEREVVLSRWVANDPFFMAPSALDNMPNFQQGIISALARFAFELTDQIGRTRGSSQTDPDLQKAAGQLQYEGNVWVFDLSTSLVPTVTSEARYRAAGRALRNYNARLAAGTAVFERRADNLLATLDRFALDLGASSATLDNHISKSADSFIDWQADDIFYGVKGQTYAYYLLLRELGEDYANVIAERQLTSAWTKMLESLRQAAELAPWVVVNGAPDGQFLPSHLAAQGFYLLRARTKLREITDILLK